MVDRGRQCAHIADGTEDVLHQVNDVTQQVAKSARAGVLASANDLLPAALLVAPGLLGVRRSLTRLLGQPVGLSGSGPTLWTVYPSLGDAQAAAEVVGTGVTEGTIPTIGSGPPSIIATTIRTGHEGPAP